MTMPLRTAPPPPLNATNTSSSLVGNNNRKAPPPRPPPPKIASPPPTNTGRPRKTNSSPSSRVLANLFGKSKNHSNTNLAFSTSQHFSLPMPPLSTKQTSISKQPQSTPEQLISFDSPPNSPIPSHQTTTHTPTQQPGFDLLSADPFVAPTLSKSESGFEDSFANWDPFSPTPSTMPMFEPQITNASNTPFAVRDYRTDFLDPLCNGKSLLAPEPTMLMPTIIKPNIQANAASKQQSISMSSGFGSRTTSEHTLSSSSSSLSYHPQEESYAIALYSFEPAQDGDLSLTSNEKVYLLKKINDDWYYGRKRSGQEGVFPSSYIEVKVPITNETTDHQEHVVPNKRALVSFDFTAQTSEDLTLKEHETVTVLYAINDDWWYGEIGQRRGQFPSAFVELV